ALFWVLGRDMLFTISLYCQSTIYYLLLSISLPNIETFPHHLHMGDDVKPSEEPTFVEILEKIEEGVAV
ncbi:MAG: DUF6516 family protein, partial [Methanosarcinales archaeon]|nr:DUF6516 family protein [Methanosarcinales archaeon]